MCDQSCSPPLGDQEDLSRRRGSSQPKEVSTHLGKVVRVLIKAALALNIGLLLRFLRPDRSDVGSRLRRIYALSNPLDHSTSIASALRMYSPSGSERRAEGAGSSGMNIPLGTGLEALVKVSLALNLGSVLRLLRSGHREFGGRIAGIFELSNPFDDRRSIAAMVRTYCVGRGVEVGPGSSPYCDPSSTVFADKFEFKQTRQGIAVTKIENAWKLPYLDNQFDYLFSSHCLEHCPDAIRTLLEWCRVLKPHGRLVLILPHGLRTFDRGRALTSVSHHIQDYETAVDLSDPTHWEEYERISIPASPPPWLNLPQSHLQDGRINWKWIYENGHIHYHVWSTKEMVELLMHLDCRVLFNQDCLPERPDSFAVVAEVTKQ